MDGTLDLDTDTIYCMLVTSSYSPDIDTHTRRTDVTNEVSGSGYAAGGAEITNKQVTQDNTDDEGVWDSTVDLTWGSSTITARAAVLYKSTGGASNDNLICYVDFGEDKSSSNGDFTIQWNSEGILNAN